MEQIRGIEPPTSEWKSDILPLNYICILWTIIVHYLLIRKISKLSLQTVYNIFIVFSTTFKKRNTILQFCNTDFLREKLFTHFKHLLIIFIDNPTLLSECERLQLNVLFIHVATCGRRCGIRTPLQHPKCRVLPLHYILYVAVGVGFEPTHDFSSSGLVDRPLQPLGYPTILVLVVGIEPTRCFHQQILSLSCLPIPSYQRVGGSVRIRTVDEAVMSRQL